MCFWAHFSRFNNPWEEFLDHSRENSFSFLLFHLQLFPSYSPCTLDIVISTFEANVLLSTLLVVESILKMTDHSRKFSFSFKFLYLLPFHGYKPCMLDLIIWSLCASEHTSQGSIILKKNCENILENIHFHTFLLSSIVS